MLHVKCQDFNRGFNMSYEASICETTVHAIIGASGAGKSTLLSIVAGATQIPGAEIKWFDQVWQGAGVFVPPHLRSCVWVDQHASLWPHLTVRQQLHYVKKRARRALPRQIEGDLPTLFGVEHLLDRTIQGLSGGESQRVALLRAWMAYPELLMLDEPLSAVDSTSRMAIGALCAELAESLGVKLIWVTHSESEVARIAHAVTWIDAGEVVRNGSVPEVLTAYGEGTHQEDSFSVLEGAIESQDEFGITHVSVGGVFFKLMNVQGEHPKGHPIRFVCRSKDISVCTSQPESTSVLNQFAMRVDEMDLSPSADVVSLRLTCEQFRLRARITRYSQETLAIKEGSQVWAQVKATAIY